MIWHSYSGNVSAPPSKKAKGRIQQKRKPRKRRT